MRRSIAHFLFIAIALLVPAWSGGDDLAPQSPASSPYTLRSSVMGGAGAPTQASGLRQRGTLSQPTPVGVSTESGNTLYAGFWRAWMNASVVGIEEETRPILTTRLGQNHPNPFGPATSIEYTIAEAGPVAITVYNIRGQRVRLLVSEHKLPGRHQVTWDGASDQGVQVARGVYFYRLRAGAFAEVKKMILLD